MGDFFMFLWLSICILGFLWWIKDLFKDKTRYFYINLNNANEYLGTTNTEFVIFVKNAPTDFFSEHEIQYFRKKEPMMWQIKMGITEVPQEPTINNILHLALKDKMGDIHYYYKMRGEEIAKDRAQEYLDTGITPIFCV